MVQLGLERRTGGIPPGTVTGKFRHRIPKLAAYPLELRELRLGQERGDSRRGLNLRRFCGTDIRRSLPPQLKAQTLVFLIGNPFRQPRRPLGIINRLFAP